MKYEKELFIKINNMINTGKAKSENIRTASKMYWQMA